MAVVKTTLLVLVLSGGAAIAGEAAAPAGATEATAKPAATDAAKSPRARECPNISGTRIRSNPAGGCRSAVGPTRVYTREDLARTGEIDINEALRKLDPIFH